MFTFLAPYRKAVAAAIVPSGLALILELGWSPDWTLRDVLKGLAVAVAGGGSVFTIRNTPKG